MRCEKNHPHVDLKGAVLVGNAQTSQLNVLRDRSIRTADTGHVLGQTDRQTDKITIKVFAPGVHPPGVCPHSP